MIDELTDADAQQYFLRACGILEDRLPLQVVIDQDRDGKWFEDILRHYDVALKKGILEQEGEALAIALVIAEMNWEERQAATRESVLPTVR